MILKDRHIILQVVTGSRGIDPDLYGTIRNGRTYLEILLDRLFSLDSFRPATLLVSSSIRDDKRLGPVLSRSGLPIRVVGENETVNRAFVEAARSVAEPFVVRIMGTNPFTDAGLVEAGLSRLREARGGYLSFEDAPTGWAPSEIFSRELLDSVRDDAAFENYLARGRDVNSLSFFRKGGWAAKAIRFATGLGEHRAADLTVTGPDDVRTFADLLAGRPAVSELAAARTIDRITTAHIEPTNFCNLGCIMCPRIIRDEENHLTLANFEIILSKLRHLRSISLNGDGEPFMNPEFPEIVERAKKAGLTVRTVFNATIPLKDDRLRKVLSNLDMLTISFDGARKESFEKIRVNANFERTLGVIRRVTAMIREEKIPLLRFWINYVIQKDNRDEIVEMVRLVHSMGAPALNFKLMNSNWDRGDATRIDDKKEKIRSAVVGNQVHDIESIHADIGRAAALGRELGVAVHFESDIPIDFSFVRCGEEKDVFITADGYVTPCCLRPNPRIFNFGNIFRDDYEAIFGGEKYLEHKRALLADNPSPLCRTCPSIETITRRLELARLRAASARAAAGAPAA